VTAAAEVSVNNTGMPLGECVYIGGEEMEVPAAASIRRLMLCGNRFQGAPHRTRLFLFATDALINHLALSLALIAAHKSREWLPPCVCTVRNGEDDVLFSFDYCVSPTTKVKSAGWNVQFLD
jgi:hypothetical protein